MINWIVRPTYSRLETYSAVIISAAFTPTAVIDVIIFAVAIGVIGLVNETLYRSAIGKDKS